jgi:hypothetical protein
MTSAWATRLLVVALAVQAALPAPAAAAARGAPPASQQPLLPRGKRSGLEARVATLTRALGLDARQQDALRTLLRDQRQQVQQIWNDESVSPADRVAATRKVSLRSADRIRAMLNEEQRKKYDPPPQGDPGKTIGNARVEDWMKGDKTQ